MFSRNHAFTVIELIAVILIISLISAFSVLKLSGISSWRYESEMRKFANTLELVLSDAESRGETYRVIVNIPNNTYRVLREIPLEAEEVKQVDYLDNLRLDSEKDRRRKEAAERENRPKTAKTKDEKLTEEFESEDRRQSGELDRLFYSVAYSDPYQASRLGPPLSFPSLENEIKLSTGLNFRDVVIDGEKSDSEETALSINSQGIQSTIAVRLVVEDSVFTILAEPGNNSVQIIPGEAEDKLGDKLGQSMHER